MDKPTLDQLAAKLEAQQKEIDELRSGLDYVVYGIGTPHSDPRGQGEPVSE